MQLRDNNIQRYPNMWCFPGGTIEGGEDVLSTIIREAKEEYEVNLESKNCRFLMEYELPYGSIAKVYVCKMDDSQYPKMHEGAEMKWMKIDEIKNFSLAFEQNVIIPYLEKFLFFLG